MRFHHSPAQRNTTSFFEADGNYFPAFSSALWAWAVWRVNLGDRVALAGVTGHVRFPLRSCAARRTAIARLGLTPDQSP